MILGSSSCSVSLAHRNDRFLSVLITQISARLFRSPSGPVCLPLRVLARVCPLCTYKVILTQSSSKVSNHFHTCLIKNMAFGWSFADLIVWNRFNHFLHVSSTQKWRKNTLFLKNISFIVQLNFCLTRILRPSWTFPWWFFIFCLSNLAKFIQIGLVKFEFVVQCNHRSNRLIQFWLQSKVDYGSVQDL